MTETSDQMSLLDAIGFSTPEATNPRKKDKPAKVGKSEKKSRKKADKPARDPVSEADPSAQDAETYAGPTSAATPAPVQAEASAQARADAPAAQADEASMGNADPTDGELPDGAPGTLPLDRFLCFALYSANHAMHGVYKALLKEAGLTYPQFLAMTVLWETNNVPVGAITSKLQLDTNTLTPLLKRLEAMGLVTRTRNVKDERQVILKLTRKGRALQKKTEHFSTCILSSTGLKLEEVMELQQKIMRLRDNLREAGLD